MDISEKTLNALQKAGWYEGREIDTKELESNLEKLGYVVYKPVRQFLKEFGMLKVEDVECQEIHDTASILTDKYNSRDGFKQIESYAGEALCLVGLVDNGYLRFFVSESGKVYCESGKLGNNGLEAWEALINKTGENYKAWGRF